MQLHTRGGVSHEQLPDSEVLLDTLLGSLGGMLYRCRLDPGFTLEFVSDGCEALTDHSAIALVERQTPVFRDLVHPDDRVWVTSQISLAALEQKPFRIVYRIITAAGDTKWVWDQGRVTITGVREGVLTDITAHKLAEDALQQRTNYLQLQQVVAATAHEAESVTDAMQTALDLVCAYTHWPVGHVYFVSEEEPRELLPAPIWHLADRERYRVFCEATMTIRLAPGMSLPGQTYLARRPIALLDVAESPHMIRAPFLKESGLQAGAGVPVFIGDEVVAVMEFFWHDAPEPGSRLLQVLTFVGAQLGRVIERQRARDALQARERQFRALIENASDVITILEANGTIRYESPAVERVLGYRPEELVGLNAFEFVHPDDQATIVAEFAQKTQEPDSVSRMEFRFRHKDGSWRMFEALGKNLLSEPGVHGVIVNSRDVTDRRIAEQKLVGTNCALAASEERYRLLFATMREGFALHEMICNEQGEPVDYRFIEVNAAFEAMTGLKAVDLLGRNVREVMPGVAPEWIRIYGPVALQGQATRVERYDASLRRHFEVFAYSPKPGQFATIISDITARKETERQLRLQGQALGAADNGIAITDVTGKILWINPAFTRLTGYTAAEVIGQSPRIMKSGVHDAAFYRQMWETVLAGNVWRGEIINRHRDGHQYVEEMTITPVVDSAGAVTHFIAIKQDISERKSVEESLRGANRRLEQALTALKTTQHQVVQQERLRALGTMASGIAHDFNNALSSILGFSELLLHRPTTLDDRAKTLRFLQLINTAAKDAGNVVNRLREFYRHRESNELLTPVDLNELVQQAVSLTQPKWKNQALAQGVNIDVATTLADGVLMVSGNAADLREVLTNLIFNAVDAMPKGGTITIATRRAGTEAILEVSDTGSGMTEEVRQRCFEPFFSTKGERGTGLGLSMVYGIIQRHDGKVDLASAPGAGTTFTIHFPLAAGRTPADPSANLGATSVAALRLLVVEDEELVRAVVQEMLTGEGHVVTAATEGRDGLEKFRAGQFDAVFVDRAMPGMSGDQVAATIKQVEPRLPVIMLTGFGSMMQAARERPPGVDYIVSKPVTIESLRAALAKVVSGSKPG